MPELFLLVPLIFYGAFLGAIVWAIWTLHRIRVSQDSIAATLKAIDAELRARRQ